MTNRPTNYLREFLKRFPICHSLVRARECHVLSQVEFRPPVLDAGCQDGAFSEIFFGSQRCLIGLDRSLDPLRTAKKKPCYLGVVCADLEQLPFRDNSFASALANSVLEHLERPEAALREMSRALAPEGVLAVTLPTADFTEKLLLKRVFDLLRMRSLGRGYLRLLAWYYDHKHLLSDKDWTDKCAAAGLTVVTASRFLSVPYLRIHEASQLLAIHVVVVKKLFGRWILFPRLRPVVGSIVELLLRPLMKWELRNRERAGVLLLMVARKHIEMQSAKCKVQNAK